MSFDPVTVLIDSLPSLPITARRELPIIQAVYFVTIPNGTVLYIGRATILRARWAQHHRWGDVSQYPDARISWLAFNGRSALLDEIERLCISHFRPVLNRIRHEKRAPASAPLLNCPSFAIERRVGNPVARPPLRIVFRVGVLMRENGVTEGELAQRAGVSRNTVRSLARGNNTRVDLEVLQRISAALGVRPLALFEEVEDEPGQWAPALRAA